MLDRDIPMGGGGGVGEQNRRDKFPLLLLGMTVFLSPPAIIRISSELFSQIEISASAPEGGNRPTCTSCFLFVHLFFTPVCLGRGDRVRQGRGQEGERGRGKVVELGIGRRGRGMKEEAEGVEGSG